MDALKLWRRFVIMVGLIIMWGYVLNVITIYNSSFNSITGELILRIIGLFIAPLGGIMGYI